MSRRAMVVVDSGTHAGIHVPVGDFINISMTLLNQNPAEVRRISRAKVTRHWQRDCIYLSSIDILPAAVIRRA